MSAIVSCACGDSLDKVVGTMWTVGNVVAEYRQCRSCKSHRAYFVNEIPGRRVSLYADPDTSEVWTDPELGVCEFDELVEALTQTTPPNDLAILVRDGRVVARASSLHGAARVWVVERPRRV